MNPSLDLIHDDDAGVLCACEFCRELDAPDRCEDAPRAADAVTGV